LKLTIAQFTFGLQLAGQERVVVDLAKEFHKKDYRSLVCTTMFRGELVQELEFAEIPFKCLGLKKSYDPRAIFPLKHYLRENNVDVVITHGSSGCLIPRLAAIIFRVPVFIHVEHNVSYYKTFYQKIINKVLSQFTDKIVCVSESAKKSLLEIEKTNSKKVIVILNGLNTDRFRFIKKQSNDKKRPKKISIVGRFSEQKGHIDFVEASAQIVKKYKNVEFIYVGDGPLRSFIENKVKEFGLDTYSHFLGVRNDFIDLLQTFDIIVLSSLWEGLPISLLEAQYFGIASVVTDVGGNSEVVEDGYNGLLVPPKNPYALANAILRIISDPALMHYLAFNGKKIFHQKFSIEKMTNSYINLINTIFKNKKNKNLN
jgi:glycosyltransferase involved in cell wall biosynthesis